MSASWGVEKRLLERAGRAALLVDNRGTVAWANGEALRLLPELARPGADLCAKVPGFTPGGSVPMAQGGLSCERVEGGWAVFLEADGFLSAQVLDLLPAPVFWKDRAGRYRGCNHSFCELIGRTPADVLGKTVFEVNAPEAAAKYYAMDEELMTGGPDAVQRYEWETKFKDGKLRRLQFHKANICDSAGNVVGLVGTVLDITELRRLERKFSTVFSACPDIVVITEKATGRYVDVNPAYEQAAGYSREEVIGRTSLELNIWADPAERDRLVEAVAAHGRRANFEAFFRRRNGETFPAWVSMESMELDGVECMILICHDITDRKREEDLLRRTADELHRSNMELERFAYVAAHDLQEPCRTICSFAQLLERRSGDLLGEEGREYLSYMADGAQRMRDLIQGLLSYSRAGSNALRFETVELNQLASSALADLAGAIGQAGADVRVGALPTLRGDPVQLRQVLVNLIGNALKFQPPDQHPVVEVSAQHLHGFWQITVQDNGIGIAAEYAQEVFGMFRRLHGGNRYPGTGIGLALVRRVIEAHGGKVWVETKPGAGCTFRFTLPDQVS